MIFGKKKPAYTVCRACRVHFEPYRYSGDTHLDLCPAHRKPAIDLDRRKKVVADWAIENWEKLEPQIQEEMKAKAIRDHENFQAHQESQCKMQINLNPLSQAAGISASYPRGPGRGIL